jgi:hypothetical protein
MVCSTDYACSALVLGDGMGLACEMPTAPQIKGEIGIWPAIYMGGMLLN